MTCPICELLSKFELCTKADAIEHYADLMLAHEYARPNWLLINGLLLIRFGRPELERIKREAKNIIQGLPE